MKSLMTIMGLVLLQVCTAQSNYSISQLSWMEGKWERTDMKPGKQGFEIWSMTSSGLSGSGITMTGSDTSFVEKLKVAFIDGDLHYVAEVPQNPKPTLFKVTELRSGYLKCENPNHDFPKEITYERTNDQLKAVIAGNGQSMSFLFRKIQ